MSQNEIYINKVLIENLSEKLGKIEELERPFGYDEKELQAGIIALKENYNEQKHGNTKKIQRDITNLIEKLEKKAETPQQKERLKKQTQEYSTCVNMEIIKSEPELYKLLEDKLNKETKLEEEILELNEEELSKNNPKTGNPDLVYIYNKTANFIEGFSDYISEKFIKFYNQKDTDFTKSYAKECLNQDFDILQKLKATFPFLPDQFFTEEKDIEILKKDPNSLSESGLERRIVAANRLKSDLGKVCQCFYQEIVKEVSSSNVFIKKKFGMSKNEVYEIDDPFLNETLIIKKSKDNNLKSEKEIIDHYKFYSSEIARWLCLCIAVNTPVPIKAKRELQRSLGEFFNIDLVEVINFETYKNEQYLFLKRKKGLNFLEYLENLKKIQETIMTAKDFQISLDKSLKILDEFPNNFRYLKSIFKNAKNQNKNKEYKIRLLEIIKTDIIVNFQYCLKSLANLNACIPTDLIDKEFTNGGYKEEIQNVILGFEKDLGKKFSEQFKDEFLKNYEVIDLVLSSAQKSLYKDAYLKNWIIDDSKLFDKKNQDVELNSKIIPIDFERCAIAPVQIDLAFLLDFGNFIEDKEKDELIDYYIRCANRFKGKDDPNLIFDIKKFKRVFDYACVHRNLLTFRSYSRFIEEGDNSKEAKDYKKISLENSIKALQKLISHEKNNIDKLESFCKNLENVYRKIYR